MPTRGLLRRGARLVRDTGRWRLVATGALLLLALFLAGWDWNRPLGSGAAREIPTADAERGLYDWRAATFAPRVAQDQRILMVVYDDQTLIATRKRSPLDRGLLARALRNMDAMGAKSIGIDILFDQPQDEDGELLSALRSMHTPVWLATPIWATIRNRSSSSNSNFWIASCGRRGRRKSARPASGWRPMPTMWREAGPFPRRANRPC
nr:CHASE2 domain-containing protein [Sphingobium fuliginis]